MIPRTTPLREAAGVSLVQVDELTTRGEISSSRYELFSPLAVDPRVFDDEAAAHSAFDRGVQAMSGVDHWLGQTPWTVTTSAGV